MRLARMSVVVGVLWLTMAPAEAAPVLYTLQSGQFVTATGVLTTSDSITGSMILPNIPPFTNPGVLMTVLPTEFSFSAGSCGAGPCLTITQNSASFSSFRIDSISPGGLITTWDVELISAAGSISATDIGDHVRVNNPSGGDPLGTGDSPSNFGGRWTGPVPVPEPTTLGLFGLVLWTAVGRRALNHRRERQAAASSDVFCRD
jgi:hypothetical protein